MRVNVMAAARTTNFRKFVKEQLGTLDDYDLLYSNVLVAGYIRPEKTAGGIIRPDANITEDRHQGKIGLILKIGDNAFKYDGPYEYVGKKPKVGDYIMYHSSDARELALNGVSCRLIDSSLIRMIVPDPDAFY